MHLPRTSAVQIITKTTTTKKTSFFQEKKTHFSLLSRTKFQSVTLVCQSKEQAFHENEDRSDHTLDRSRRAFSLSSASQRSNTSCSADAIFRSLEVCPEAEEAAGEGGAAPPPNEAPPRERLGGRFAILGTATLPLQRHGSEPRKGGRPQNVR